MKDYAAYGRDLVAAVPDRHISFEVFSDDIPEMVAQARIIAPLGQERLHQAAGDHDTRGTDVRSRARAVARGRQDQYDGDVHHRTGGEARSTRLAGGAPACVSVFAGRLADFGIDYRADDAGCHRARAQDHNVEIIWASTREAFNVVEADAMGCHIITAPADILKKLPALGTKTAAELSLDAVKAFREDALAAGLTLDLARAPSRCEWPRAWIE